MLSCLSMEFLFHFETKDGYKSKMSKNLIIFSIKKNPKVDNFYGKFYYAYKKHIVWNSRQTIIEPEKGK